MKKPAVIRNDAPHEISIAPGSNVAKGKKTEHHKEFVAEPPPPVIVKPEPASPASPRGRTKIKKAPPAEPRSKPARARSPGAAPAPAAPRPAADVGAIWAKNSAAAARLAELKARNAQLDEQIQRLNESLRSKGKTP